MKFGVVVFPGSNCDHDLIHVLEKVSGQAVVELWHKDHDLQDCDFIFLPGGFSYGDYLRSGAIAKLSPIMTNIIDFANRGGFVMGICNGFQILCESGLLPGALAKNENQLFVCDNVYLKCENNTTALTNKLDSSTAYKIPIAHSEGRFLCDKDVLENLEANKQVLFRYCDSNASVSPESNPNGSVNDIAGICNKNRNVFGMMPHPERAADAELYNQDGLAMFESILAEIASAKNYV
jgi:phosphoribosylformylglycinamidine synthase subunit PurQ / glutaminase